MPDVVRRLVEVKEAIENLGREIGMSPERAADLADELARVVLVGLAPARQAEQAALPEARAVQPADPPAMLTVAELALRLGISRGTAYELVRSGRIPYVRFGRVIKIPSAALDEWVMREVRERS
jgi:excisionase family DNA binding protein